MGSSWVDLETHLGSKMCGFPVVFQWFCENLVFRKSKVSRGNLGRTWVNLGAQKAPKWRAKASQDGAKKEKKNEVKLEEAQRGFREA